MFDETDGRPLQRHIGGMTFSHPDAVFSDACHRTTGITRGPWTPSTVSSTALIEQQGWADVTAPSDISVDGYVGKAFQRTAPADMSDCTTRDVRHEIVERCRGTPRFPELGATQTATATGRLRTGHDRDLVGPRPRRHGRRHQHGQLSPEPSAAAHADFAADVLDSIRIERP